MIKWLLGQVAVQKFVETILKQGFSVVLLICAVGWFGFQNYLIREEMKSEVNQMRKEIQNCHDQVLQYYRDDKSESNKVMDRAVNVMERLEKKM